MKLLARFVAGNVALWCTFWLVGIPLALVWDAGATCMLVGCGIEDEFLAELVIALFALSAVALPVVAVAIWRSASNYPRHAWWHTLFAIGAKVCAALTGLG